MTVRPAGPADRAWIESFLEDHGWTQVARRNELVPALDHPMLIALDGDEPAGFLTYVLVGDACEVLTLNAVRRWHGAGTALLEAIAVIARDAGCTRLWLVTTNDNVDALRFYQRRGYRLRQLRVGAIDRTRRELKPEIPEIGDHGIPIHDEIELELDLTAI